MKKFFDYKSPDFTLTPFVLAILLLMVCVLVISNPIVKIVLTSIQLILLVFEIVLAVKNNRYLRNGEGK